MKLGHNFIQYYLQTYSAIVNMFHIAISFSFVLSEPSLFNFILDILI